MLSIKPISTYKTFSIYPLTKQLAQKYQNQILTTWDQIKFTEPHTPQRLMATVKNNHPLLHKWDHSLIAIHQKESFAGFVISYERSAEENNLYPINSIYFNSFAVNIKFQKQGLGRHLIQSWLTYNQQLGYLSLTGPLSFSVQTNSAS